MISMSFAPLTSISICWRATIEASALSSGHRVWLVGDARWPRLEGGALGRLGHRQESVAHLAMPSPEAGIEIRGSGRRIRVRGGRSAAVNTQSVTDTTRPIFCPPRRQRLVGNGDKLTPPARKEGWLSGLKQRS